MADQSWLEAITEILQGLEEPMRYTDIADEVKKRGLRSKLGATPSNTVNATISDSIRAEGPKSPFERVAPGLYRLRLLEPDATAALVSPSDTTFASTTGLQVAEPPEEPAGLINALGMYWSRDQVNWSTTPKLFGRQQSGDVDIDFSDQRGVYLLYDRNTVIYVGRAIDQGIGSRLRQHTTDRLRSRWDRFSWFGIYAVAEDGSLTKNAPTDASLLIATMEALLIEAVEPRQNRRRGDDFAAVEFLQGIDPEIEVINLKRTVQQLQDRIGFS